MVSAGNPRKGYQMAGTGCPERLWSPTFGWNRYSPGDHLKGVLTLPSLEQSEVGRKVNNRLLLGCQLMGWMSAHGLKRC